MLCECSQVKTKLKNARKKINKLIEHEVCIWSYFILFASSIYYKRDLIFIK